MTWVFWFLIVLALVFVWLALINLFRPVGKGVNFVFKALDEIINGNDDNNKLTNEEDTEQ